MDFALDERIMENWENVLSHPTERHRPTREKQGFTSEEIGYNTALNIGKRVFLGRVGDELCKRYPQVKTKVFPYGDAEGMLGYGLVIPYSIIPPARTIRLACVGNYDRDLMVHANNPTIIDLIRELASGFEQEVINLETKPSGLNPLKVYVKSDRCRFLALSDKVERYLQKKLKTN